MLLRDKLFCVLMVLLALSLMFATLAWNAVRAWPEARLVQRAWWGDKAAMDEMGRRAMMDGDIDSHLYWADMRGELSEREILFMDQDSRRIFWLLRKAQGVESPLLEVVVKK